MTKSRNGMWLALLCAAAGCRDDRELENTSFVLVHGAWNGAWAWSEVQLGLEERGAAVTTVELPAHGEDQTPIASVSLRAYVDAVEAAIDAAPAPVVLVGHSMGGMVVTEAADERASVVDRLIYVTAFVPAAGDSLLSLSMQDPDSELGPALVVQMAQGVVGVTNDRLTPVFCADCDAAAADLLHARYRDEPLAPFTEPAQLAAGGWAGVAKYYIYAADDHAISPASQLRMTAAVSWSATASLPTGHSPFLSAPSALADQLADFARR